MKNDLPAELASTELAAPVAMGFGDLKSFEFMQRAAKMFAASTMVPTAYQAMITKGYGDRATTEANPAALSNCMIALDMSQRMHANPLMIMQNLHVIEGRPSWSSQFIIAAINGCGKFSPLRFDLQWLDEMDATYSTFEWENRQKVERKHKVRIRNARCVAWAIEKATGERLESAPVTMEMSVNEGWYGKNGSKWRSMPDLMMRYRSAAFFGRIYAPELLMGLPTAEEVRDIIDVEPQADGSYAMGATPKAEAATKAPSPMSKSERAAAAEKAAQAAAESFVRSAGVTDVEPRESSEGVAPAAQAANDQAVRADPAPAPAAAPAPAPVEVIDQKTGEITQAQTAAPAADMISANQAKYLRTKIDSIGLDDAAVATMLARHGAAEGATIETLTVDQFNAVKSELLQAGV